MDTQFIFFIVLVFIATFFILETVYYWWMGKFGEEANRLRGRLDDINDEHLKKSALLQGILKHRYESQSKTIARLLDRFPVLDKVDNLLIQSGSMWDYKKLILLCIASFFLALVVGALLRVHFVPLLIVAVLSMGVPFAYLFIQRSKRLNIFEEQLPEAIDSITRSIKAGQSFNAAFSMVAEEFSDPIASEFNLVLEENKLGIGINEAMLNLGKRIPITDLQFLIVAVLIQRESGGNLAEILSNISGVIRQRFTLGRQIKVMTAEGRMSGRVLGAMPIVMLGVMSLLDKNYAEIMFQTETGHYWLKVGAVLMVIGFFWISRTVKIKM